MDKKQKKKFNIKRLEEIVAPGVVGGMVPLDAVEDVRIDAGTTQSSDFEFSDDMSFSSGYEFSDDVSSGSGSDSGGDGAAAGLGGPTASDVIKDVHPPSTSS